MAHCTRCGSRISDQTGLCHNCDAPGGSRSMAKWLVGRGGHCNVVLNFPTVSSEHCSIRRVPGGYEVTDLNSTNGTFLRQGSPRISRPETVAEDSAIWLGSYRFSLKSLTEADIHNTRLTRGGSPPAESVALLKHRTVIGRDPSCDIPVDHPRVSWRHACIEVKGDQFLISDLGSSNGTFVNGRRVRNSILNVGDKIVLGGWELTFNADKTLGRRSAQGDVSVAARNLWVTVPDKTCENGEKILLEDVSFTVYPGEFVAIMGPSGAGKSTLLYSLLGIMPPAQGEALINGMNVLSQSEVLKDMVGYVPQDDIMHPELNVREVLRYAAKLRLPSDTSEAEIDDRVDRTLEMVGLKGIDNVLVGSAEKKGISGGQKKRLNIALELLTEPSLLLLDEPTSGLSSEDALSLIEKLRDLADKGKTIILTIHQPGYRVYSAFDSVLILTGTTRTDRESGATQGRPFPGRLAYYGPPVANFGVSKDLKPDSITFFNPDIERLGPDDRVEVLKDPEAPLAGLERRQSDFWVDSYRNHRFFKEFVTDRATSPKAIPNQNTAKHLPRPNPFSQWWLLTKRYAQVKRRDAAATIGLLAQAPVIGGLLAIVFDKKDSYDIPIFLLVVVAIWFGCINSVTEIVKEKAIFRRERMVFLGLGPYLLSKVAILGLLSLIQSATLLAILVAALHLKGPWLAMLGIMFLCSMGGLAMGFLLSAVRPTLGSAMSILPIALTAQIVLGGAMQPLPAMDVLPKSLRLPQWAAQLTLSRWGYESLLSMEEKARRKTWKKEECPVVSCAAPDPQAALSDMPQQPQGQPTGDMVGQVHPAEGGDPNKPPSSQVRRARDQDDSDDRTSDRDGKTARTDHKDGECMEPPQVPVCCLFQSFQMMGKSEDRDYKWRSCDEESTFESWDEVPLTNNTSIVIALSALILFYFGCVFAALKWKK